MEALFKPPLIAGMLLLALAVMLTACAMPSKVSIGTALSSPSAERAAIGVEGVVATMAISFSTLVEDPEVEIDRLKLGLQVDKAAEVLGKARKAFDARGGGVSSLVGEALGLVSDAIPPGTSLSARFALSTAFAGVQVYAATLDQPGLPATPSDDLAQARARTDRAVAVLLHRLRSSPAPP